MLPKCQLLKFALIAVAVSLLSYPAYAEDFWDSVFDDAARIEGERHKSHADADDDGIFLPMRALSFETHGAYFGSGNEFLMGGSHVMGMGGSRHSADHNINHPTHGVYPDVQHLFGNKVGFMGPMWGAPDDFTPDYGELAEDQPAKGADADKPRPRGNPLIFSNDDWWAD